MEEWTEVEFIYFKPVSRPRFGWFPFFFYEEGELTTVTSAKIQTKDILNIEQVTNEAGELYENICNIYLREIGARTVKLSYEEACALVTRTEIGFKQ